MSRTFVAFVHLLKYQCIVTTPFPQPTNPLEFENQLRDMWSAMIFWEWENWQNSIQQCNIVSNVRLNKDNYGNTVYGAI